MPREVLRKLLGEPDASTAMGDEYDFGRSQVGVTFERDVIEYDPLVRVMSFALRRR